MAKKKKEVKRIKGKAAVQVPTWSCQIGVCSSCAFDMVSYDDPGARDCSLPSMKMEKHECAYLGEEEISAEDYDEILDGTKQCKQWKVVCNLHWCESRQCFCKGLCDGMTDDCFYQPAKK